MGVGYSASALHQIAYLVVDDDAPEASEPPPPLPLSVFPGAKVMRTPFRTRSPAASDIIAWRDALAVKYRAQLGELLTWDEASEEWRAEDAATSADLLLRYVAAIIDERGVVATHGLVGVEKPTNDEIGRALGGVARRGFTSRFPQLLLGSLYWLPFHRNMIIEAPDWQGKVKRFGSIDRFAEELREIRSLIVEAGEGGPVRPGEDNPSRRVLRAAWQASETVAKICAFGVARRLPAWTTG